MKNLLLLLGFLFLITDASAQVDLPATGTMPGGIGIPAETNTDNSTLLRSEKPSLSRLSRNGLFGGKEEPAPFSEEKKKTFSMRTDSDGLMEYKKENFKPKYFKDKPVKEEYSNDSYLGDFKTGGEYVEIYFRDHEYVDGDRVRIYLNGEVVANNVALKGGYYPLLAKLKSGLNHIEFEALNQGTSGPNTAELKVFDDLGKEMTSDEWNLTTGAKASMVVVKQ